MWIREIRNWFFIKQTIKKEINKPNGEWTSFKLRTNWYGRIYTVISLKEEDLGEEVMVQNFKAMEKMKPINEYLANLDFSEIMYPSIEKIPESLSYLIVYSPLFTEFTTRNIIKTTAVILLIGIGIFTGINYIL